MLSPFDLWHKGRIDLSPMLIGRRRALVRDVCAIWQHLPIRWHAPDPPVETPFDEPTFFEWLATGSSVDFGEPESFDCVAEAAGISRQDAMIAVTIAWSARLIFPDGTTHIETQTALERLSAAALMSGSL